MKYAAVRMERVAHDGTGVHFAETIAAKEDRRDAKEKTAGAQCHLAEVTDRDASSDCALRSLRHPWRSSCRKRSRRSACSCEHLSAKGHTKKNQPRTPNDDCLEIGAPFD